MDFGLAATAFYEAVQILGDPLVLVFLVVAVFWGCTCGVLPGAGSGLAIGVMVPLTYSLDPLVAVSFLVCISVAVSFGNGLPATLLGIPTSPASIFTAVDGYALTRQGKGGLAVATNWSSCVFGQFTSIPFFVLLVVPLSNVTYTFLSPELFGLYCLGLAAIVSLTGKNILKGLAAAAFGLAVAMVGPDPVSAVTRFDFDVPELRSGIETIPAVIGLVTVSQLIVNMRQVYGWEDLSSAARFSARFPGFRAVRRVARPIFTGSIIGTLVGAIPGLSGSSAAVMAYNQAKLTSRTPEKFGKGSQEGIAANESAQNASQAGEMAPTLGLGIPGSDSMVLVLGALMLQGFVPGPQMMKEAPELLYATVAGLLGGALFLLLFGWPLGKLMLRVTRLDRRIVLPLAFVVTHVGIYSLRRSVFDVFLMLFFGVVGYFMLRYGFSTAAAAIALVLGAGFESNLRQGLLLMDSDLWAFVSRPWTATFLAVSLLLLVYGSYTTVKNLRQERAAAASRSNASGAASR
jgi:putative tricarboxylic transport membrane protein